MHTAGSVILLYPAILGRELKDDLVFIECEMCNICFYNLTDFDWTPRNWLSHSRIWKEHHQSCSFMLYSYMLVVDLNPWRQTASCGSRIFSVKRHKGAFLHGGGNYMSNIHARFLIQWGANLGHPLFAVSSTAFNHWIYFGHFSCSGTLCILEKSLERKSFWAHSLGAVATLTRP